MSEDLSHPLDASDELSADASDDFAVVTRIGHGRLTLRRFFRNKLAVFGLCGLALLILLAIFGPMLTGWDYLEIDKRAFLKAPSSSHWLGTTRTGRDVLALTLHGMSRSLIIGFVAATLSTLLSSTVGTTSAYFGGWVERVLLWVTDLMLIVPSLLIIGVTMRGGLSGNMAWVALAFMLGLFGWMTTGRVVRSLTLSLKNREYVLAAKYMGLPAWRIIIRHILPNISSLMIVDLTLGVGYAVLGETGLSFLGLGVQAPDTSLGTLIGEGAQMAVTYSWIFLSPAAVLVFLVFCINAIGDGIRDALDPSSQSGGAVGRKLRKGKGSAEKQRADAAGVSAGLPGGTGEAGGIVIMEDSATQGGGSQ
ncbi:MAG: ABC transporter permease [Propionibacteriaceae bacterium]|jgi:peptide/nickel transport system permease protein|nr:ABC transporter permease [Propionibacteriaceae bacterium]